MTSSSRLLTLAVTFGFVISGLAPATGSETLVHAFRGGADGNGPAGTLVSDATGNLYGTTTLGGHGCPKPGCGVIFEIAADGTENVLYAFQGGSDGANPFGNLLRDKAGNFYGTTGSGGSANAGTVFKFAPNGTESVLYTFQGATDGALPNGSPIADKNGNLYGTTMNGGSANFGTVFEVEPNGTEKTLYTFLGGSDGANSWAGVIADTAGNLYGTTAKGGVYNCGTVFKLKPNGTETVLYAFQGGTDGCAPLASLVADDTGNLYGTTIRGGDEYTCTGGGCGTVFKVSPSGVETLLYTFHYGNDGYAPTANLVLDKDGSFYSTTSYGGKGRYHGVGCGTAFRLASDGTEKVLYGLPHHGDGCWPYATLFMGRAGLLYGSTTEGGVRNNGVIFSVTKTK